MSGLKYHWIPVLIIAALLLRLPSSGHAGPAPQPAFQTAYLWFSIEQHPGKADWVTCLLNLNGDFRVYQQNGGVLVGNLTEQETRRILEEYEKLCVTAGEYLFAPVIRPRGAVAGGGAGIGQARAPFFSFRSPQGKQLELEGPQRLPPPELTGFLRILWQKLLSQPPKKPDDKPARSLFRRLFTHTAQKPGTSAPPITTSHALAT